MSVIQKIRTKYAKLAGGVIAVALVAFILMDALSSRSGNLFGNDDSIVKVNGEKIDYITYTQRTNDYEVLYSGSRTIDDDFRAQINGMALSDLVKEALIKEEAEKIGLTVTEAERKDMIYGADPDQAVKSYQPFTNPDTKAFDPQYVKLFEEQADQLDPTGKARLHWETYKSFIQRNAIVKKYNALFAAAAYVPTFLAKANSEQQSHMADIDYVSLMLDPGEQEFEITDEDYKKYMSENKTEFTTDEKSRSMQYVMFNVLPAAQDTARALGFLQSIKNDFATAEDDESFVNRNSEESFKDVYVMKSGYESMYADSVFALSNGFVFGPVYERETYKLIKMLDKKQYPDSVSCRHILVNTAQRGQETLDDATAKTRIDSIVAAINSGNTTFGEMVTQYSDDAGSKEKGGEYNFAFSQKAGLTKPFGDFIFNGKAGESKVVKVESSGYSGYHYIEILKQGPSKTAIKTATITKALFAGDDTETEIYARANEFASSSTSAEMFDSVAKEKQLQILAAGDVKVNDFSIYNIGPSREIIRWMYNAEVGEVSQVFAMNSKYIVAKLTEIKKPGVRKLDEELRGNLEPQVKNMKLAQQLAQKYSSAKSLDEIAKSASGEVKTADSIRGNNSFTGAVGYAPKIVGYSTCPDLKLNAVSKPIIEQAAVYFIKVKNRYKNAVEDTTFTQKERETMQMEMRNTFGSQIAEQLKDKADVKYNADNF